MHSYQCGAVSGRKDAWLCFSDEFWYYPVIFICFIEITVDNGARKPFLSRKKIYTS